MKILFVSSGNDASEISNLALSQANSLVGQNVNVELYYIKGKGIIGYLKNILPLHKQIKNKHYNIIHAHYGLSGWIALIAKNKRTKLVISFMGNDILGDHANKGSSTSYGNLLVALNLHFAKYADYIVVKSNEMSQKIKIANKSIIPNGVNLSIFCSLDRNVALKKVGWNPALRHVLFMSNPDRPEKNFSLTNTALKLTEIESIQLHFLNQIPQNELVYYYNAAEVCILTSYHEGSPNVIKEAMACNRPIVCTDVGDVSWQMGNTKGCYICSFDPMDIATKVRFALEFSQTKICTKGRDRIIELGLDSETIAGKIIEVYNKVLKIEKN